ncbi:hypothetical protein CFC21_108964 [Triticum aestivum]|uniref:Uncharacterized protein n=2 Tax=Triticum aestivum TaxID=4565 RepID=A0A9R1MJH8_WHEAT|nr:uncharacterized protein LOC123167484 [Triticum aestivum]KAF7108511.1 hypothetical protein CFC21_108964 [Triticum aestivum]
MAEYDEQGMAIAAAEILLSLRTRKLARWPEWVPRPSNDLAPAAADLQRPEDAEDELPPIPERWPKRPRLSPRAVAKGTAWLVSWESPFARLGEPVLARSGACSSGEERARSHPRVTKAKRAPLAARRPETPPYYVSATGSGPSTSGMDRARSRRRPRVSEKAQATAAAWTDGAMDRARSRRRPRVSEKAQATAAAWTDGAMAASSPETPFDYANAAGSGASSSGDEVARSTAKRKAQGPGGSGVPSSGDEGCSSPAKRARADVSIAGAVQPAPGAVKLEDQKTENNYRDEKGHLMFDLNEDPDMAAEW